MQKPTAYRVKARGICRHDGLRVLSRHFKVNEWTIVRAADLTEEQLARMLRMLELTCEPLSDETVKAVDDERRVEDYRAKRPKAKVRRRKVKG